MEILLPGSIVSGSAVVSVVVKSFKVLDKFVVHEWRNMVLVYHWGRAFSVDCEAHDGMGFDVDVPLHIKVADEGKEGVVGDDVVVARGCISVGGHAGWEAVDTPQMFAQAPRSVHPLSQNS